MHEKIRIALYGAFTGRINQQTFYRFRPAAEVFMILQKSWPGPIKPERIGDARKGIVQRRDRRRPAPYPKP
ncbi:hypothetical protein AA0243_0472 [Novacetimonas hansenii NRIC 0243]|nr:hypothetical protein AA0243_0472 [Novacetimonas hansenii NRIC 0243]